MFCLEMLFSNKVDMLNLISIIKRKNQDRRVPALETRKEWLKKTIHGGSLCKGKD